LRRGASLGNRGMKKDSYHEKKLRQEGGSDTYRRLKKRDVEKVGWLCQGLLKTDPEGGGASPHKGVEKRTEYCRVRGTSKSGGEETPRERKKGAREKAKPLLNSLFFVGRSNERGSWGRLGGEKTRGANNGPAKKGRVTEVLEPQWGKNTEKPFQSGTLSVRQKQ